MTAAPIRIRLLYFAWVREQIGLSSEEIELPAPISLSALTDYLQKRSKGHAQALADRTRLRAAVNQQFSAWETTIQNGDEVAIFPPVTGGNSCSL